MTTLPFDKGKQDILSVANLPDDVVIDDPREFIKMFRTHFLGRARNAKGLSLEEASKQIGISKSELIRIEDANVNAQDIMVLSKISELYSIDYSNLLFLFRLAQRPDRKKIQKIAAYHQQQLDEKTQEEILKFINELKDSVE